MNKKIILLSCILFVMQSNLSGQSISPGAEQTQEYIPYLQGKRVGVVANQTSVIGSTHLVDSLLSLGIQVQKIFSPEHGFRGQAEAGAFVFGEIDPQTKLPLVSLYGKEKKLQNKDLVNIDVLILDIQDVGARFYTYISTLHYVMLACAENNIPLVILDRPNPNGFYIDGPVLTPSCSSFVGMHPVPIVHGMTMAEYAQMINGEKWLENGKQCTLRCIQVKNYTHDSLYTLPISPSPNLPTMNAIYLYPSLCWFEGTSVSIGRGTSTPFEIIGSPYISQTPFSFTPQPIKGVSENPPHKNKVCYGYNLQNKGKEIVSTKQIDLRYLIEIYQQSPKPHFFIPFFDKLSGTPLLKKTDTRSENRIRNQR